MLRGALLGFTLLLAGCTSPVPVDPAAIEPLPSTASVIRFELGSDGLLAPVSKASLFPLQWGYAEWLDGQLAPAWSTGPSPESYLILSAFLTFSVTTDAPMIGPQVRSELTAWFGVGDRIVEHGFYEGPEIFLPGSHTIVETTIRLPPGGVVVEKGEAPVLRLGSYYEDSALGGHISVILGDPQRRSELLLEVVPLTVDPYSATNVLDVSGRLIGGRCLNLDGASEMDAITYEIDVPETAKGVTAQLHRTGGDGPPDLDIALFNATGARVGRGAGSGVPEEIRLYPPNMAVAGSGTWTLLVYNCTPQAADFHAVVDILE